MKRAISFAFIILAIYSCSPDREEKAHKLIKEHLSATLTDFTFYEPVEFSKLDTAFLEFRESQKGKKLAEEITNAEHDLMNIYKPINDCKNNLIALQKKYRIEKALYKPEYGGWQMIHLFKYIDTQGVKITKMKLFKFDQDLTEVSDEVDIENMDIEDLTSLSDITSKSTRAN